jgi:hypothetical protein
MGLFSKKDTKIVDGSGYAVSSEEEIEEFYARQQAAEDEWEASKADYYEAVAEYNFQQRVAREEAEWRSRSVWGKLTRPRLRPIR